LCSEPWTRPRLTERRKGVRALHFITLGIINTFISLILSQLEVLRGEIVLRY
jgi:hypothetical protein